jgi:hypothetical protein
MTKAQRLVLKEALWRAERGPSFGLSGYGRDTEKQFETNARLWADTWIAANIRAVLEVEGLSDRLNKPAGTFTPTVPA